MGYKKDDPNVFTKEDFAVISDQEIYDVITREGKPMLARTLQISTDALSEWIKKRGIKIPVSRNANYYNARKPSEEQGEWETALCEGILRKMEEARSIRLKSLSEGIEERICPTCGKSFTVKKDSTQKYCSQECVNYRIRSDEEKEKLSQACMGRTSWNAGRKMSAIEKRQMIQNIKKGWTKEKRELQSQQQKEVWSNDVLREQMSDIKTKQYEDQGLHDKVSINTMLAMRTPEIRQKVIEAANAFETKEKRRQTNLERYGVEWTVQSEQYINAKPRGHTNETWRKWLQLPIESTEFPLGRYVYDFKYDDNTLVEINPTFTHHSSDSPYLNEYTRRMFKDKNYHINKLKVAEDNGYKCVMIWDWDNKDTVLNQFAKKEPVYARKCEVLDVNKDETKQFLNSYHLQGNCIGDIVRLGLFYDGELIELMTFGKPRYNKKYQWELLRLCTKSGYMVIGGAEKLFKAFCELYKPESVVSYCDRSKFSGEVYIRLGFELTGKLKPSKHWYHPFTGRHLTNSLLMQRGFSQLHGDSQYKYAVKGDSNEELMIAAGYLPVYDCGQATYIYFPK